MSRNYSIDNTNIRDCVRNGYTQHVALVFPGTPFDIISDEYVAVEGGFTLNEYLNQDDDIVPGNVKSYVFSSTLLNHDSSLSGFDFARDFMLMVGIEKNNGTDISSSFGSGNTDKPKRLMLNNIGVLLKNDSVTFRTSGGDNYGYLLTNCRHMFAVRGAETTATYYLFIVFDDNGTRYIGNTYRIDPGDGNISQVNSVRTTHIPISDGMFARLEALAYNNVCEVWDFYTKYNTICQRFVYDGGTKTIRHDILFEHMCVLTGKPPRKTLGKIITFDAVGLSDRLNQSADSYADTVFTTSKTMKTIKAELLTAAGLNAENTSYTPENSIYYSSNPFAGMHGYTYHDFLLQIGQALGRNLIESKRHVINVVENNIPVGISIFCTFFFRNPLFIEPSYNTLRKTDYYTYDADEYKVNAVDLVVSRQTDDDVGIQYPDSPAGSNAYIVVNNQMLNDSDASIVKSRLSYLYASLTASSSYNYYPISIDMPSWLYFEPGDAIRLPLDDGVEIRIPILNMATIWNGGADCTIECTGNRVRNQYDQKEFKKTLKEGSKVHELIVDIDRVYSSIMNTLTTDYSTTSQTANQIALYVGNHAYEIVSGIDINSSGVTITGSKYISLDTSGYINLANVALINKFGMRLKVTEDPYYMRIGATGSLGTNEVLNIGYESLNGYPSFTMRTKRNPSAYEACLNIFSTPGSSGQNYDLITIAPYEYGQLGTSNRQWTGGKSWSLIYGNTINYITLEQGSSRDIKHDIEIMPDMGSIIDSLVPVTFVYNSDQTERKRYGLIHEDTYAVFPDICSGTDYSEADQKSINYVELVPILLKEIQSLRRRVNELEQKNEQN